MTNNGVYATPEIPDITEIEKARMHENAEVEKVKLHELEETKRLQITELEETRRVKAAKWTSHEFLWAFGFVVATMVIAASLCIYHTTLVVMEHIHLQNK